MQAIILARVSTKEQEEQGLSIPAQVQRLKDIVISKGFENPKLFQIVESSTKDTRKQFEEIINFIRNSKEPCILFTDTIDRLQRSFRESVELDELRRTKDLEIFFLRENLWLNKNSNSSDLMRWDMGVMFARNYVLQLSDNVKRSNDRKLANGEWPGSAPLGYININLDDLSISTKKDGRKGPKGIVPDPVKKDYIIKAFEMYGTGNYTISGLAKELSKLGLTTKNGKLIGKSSLYEILINPFYYGEMEQKGKLYKHKYEPLIPVWLFEKCQLVTSSWNKKPFKYGVKEYVFKGLIQCSNCGHTLSNYTQKGINYVRCHNCKSTHEKEDNFTLQIGQIFRQIKVPDNILNDLVTILKENHKREKHFLQTNEGELVNRKNKIIEKMEILYEDRLDQRITSNEYDKKVKELKVKEQDLIQQLMDHSKADEQFLISSSYILDLANRAYELFESSQAEQKRRLLNFVFANFSAQGSKLQYKIKEPFNELLFASKSLNWLPIIEEVRTVFKGLDGCVFIPDLKHSSL